MYAFPQNGGVTAFKPAPGAYEIENWMHWMQKAAGEGTIVVVNAASATNLPLLRDPHALGSVCFSRRL